MLRVKKDTSTTLVSLLWVNWLRSLWGQMSARKDQYYETPNSAARAAIKKLHTKYGSGPQIFIYRSPNGFGYSLTRRDKVCTTTR